MVTIRHSLSFPSSQRHGYRRGGTDGAGFGRIPSRLPVGSPGILAWFGSPAGTAAGGLGIGDLCPMPVNLVHLRDGSV